MMTFYYYTDNIYTLTFIKRRKVIAHSSQYYYLCFSDVKIFFNKCGEHFKKIKKFATKKPSLIGSKLLLRESWTDFPILDECNILSNNKITGHSLLSIDFLISSLMAITSMLFD
ncbi:hypothetical protein C0J52_01633 [Blattella germanica]|nr:hypothetical protein C0J52_01633 [Blattella germanica]